jgi:hypothetical protein
MSDKPDFNDPRNIRRARTGQGRLNAHERAYSGDLTDAQERYDQHQADRQKQREVTDAGDQGVAPPPRSNETEQE